MERKQIAAAVPGHLLRPREPRRRRNGERLPTAAQRRPAAAGHHLTENGATASR